MRSSVYPEISKKFILIPVKECLNNRVELALKTKGKQAKSKVAFCPCTSLCAPDRGWISLLQIIWSRKPPWEGPHLGFRSIPDAVKSTTKISHHQWRWSCRQETWSHIEVKGGSLQQGRAAEAKGGKLGWGERYGCAVPVSPVW